MTKEDKARAAASQWCECFKCGGIAHKYISGSYGTVSFICNKGEFETCRQWYDGYRTALIALEMEE